MSIEIKVPGLPESVSDATVAAWHKKAGDTVKRDENIVDLETDKVMLEVPAPEDGILGEIMQKEGEVVKAGDVLATLTKGGSEKKETPSATQAKAKVPEKETSKKTAANKAEMIPSQPHSGSLGPAARRAAAAEGSNGSSQPTREDILAEPSAPLSNTVPTAFSNQSTTDRVEKRVPMTRLRAVIAKRLVEVQHSAALLTTFNEVNLQKVIELRTKYKEKFEKLHDVRLGFMSFFTKAVVEALKRYPAVNASIDGNDIIYHGYFDIGIAVSTERGLMVPVVRDADQLNFAEIEKAIANFGRKARENQITIEDMTGGTFTITNGGVFGSLLNMPIINPPQSAILGMNTIQERPVAEKGQIVIRPMMYIALTYDHRIIDGKESVSFLKTVKEFLEDPSRLLINV